jgi:small GTP-binding protein
MTLEERVSLKVVLLGNSGVGKTSIVYRWISPDPVASVEPTVGVNHRRRTSFVDNREVDVYIWDTAGQEQYKALTPLYAHSSSCALIVASITDAESFEAIPRWTEVLHQSCDAPPPAILLVNKMDLTSGAVASISELEIRYRKQFHAVFFVSAVTAEGLEAAYTEAVLIAFRFQTGKSTRRSLADVEIVRQNPCC